MSIAAEFERLEAPLVEACRRVYGDRLVSLIVFGSAGRGTPGPESDLDLLIIADPLPCGRIPRVGEFDAVEEQMAPHVPSNTPARTPTAQLRTLRSWCRLPPR